MPIQEYRHSEAALENVTVPRRVPKSRNRKRYEERGIKCGNTTVNIAFEETLRLVEIKESLRVTDSFGIVAARIASSTCI